MENISLETIRRGLSHNQVILPVFMIMNIKIFNFQFKYGAKQI